MHELQGALDSGVEARLLQLEFSAAFYCVSLDELSYKLRDRGIGDNIISIFELFLTSRGQRVKIGASFSGYLNFMSGVPQGNVL